MIKVTQHNKRVIPANERGTRRIPRANVLVPRCERKQGDIPGLLDCARKAALMRCANARQPPRHNLAALGHKPLQQTNIAIRNRVNLLRTELADLLAAEELAAAARAAGGTTAGATGWPSAGARWS
jgi:hypothetical protein